MTELTSLQLSVPQSDQRGVGLMVTAFLQIPTWRFWAEKDTEEERDDGNEGRTEFESPSDPPNPLQRQIGAKAEEDTEGDPHLPTHNETTSNRSGDVFGGKNGDRRRFGTHTETEQQTADEKLLPGLGETRPDDWDKTEDGTEEDGTATSEVEVERVRKPATAVEKISTGESLGYEGGGTYTKAAEM